MLECFCKLGDLNKACPNRTGGGLCDGKNPGCSYSYLKLREKSAAEAYEEKKKARGEAWYEKYYKGSRQIRNEIDKQQK